MELISTDTFLGRYPPAVQQTAHEVRNLVRESVPDAIERVRVGWQLIGYDLPLRRYGLYFAYIAPESDHVHLGFEYGVFMDDPHGLLLGAGLTKQVRWLALARPDEIDRDATIALLAEGARVAALTRDERLALVLERAARPA
ncbi:MAG TPA: DUF1801 domain-containing protein [Candidatus Limnocylindrales bacterium]|nr:DUF1801 domain-containing protein [Candidatus Limnocylindrales bacterium]